MNIYPIPEGDLKSLEAVAEFFIKNNLWYIKLEEGGYAIKDHSEENIKESPGNQEVKSILVKNRISSVYADIDKYIYFRISNSDKIYVFSHT